MGEQMMTEQESLRLIGEMMGKAKRSYVTKGTASIVWGILIVVCSMLTWLQVQYNLNVGFDVWLLLLAAVVPQVYFSMREKKGKKFKGHDEQTITYVWATFGICIFILSFFNSRFGSEHSISLYMMIYGMPTFLTGSIVKFRPMIVGGLICWLLSVVSLFTTFSTNMLFMAACGLFAWLIPGIILWRRYQQQKEADV